MTPLYLLRKERRDSTSTSRAMAREPSLRLWEMIPWGIATLSEYPASSFSRTTRAIMNSFRFQAEYFRFSIGIMSIASSGRTGENFHGILIQEC